MYSEGVLPSHGVAIGAGGPGGTASFPWSTLIGVFSLIDVLYYAFAFRHVILQVFITLLPVTLYYESFLAPFLANGSNDCCCYSSTGNSAWTTFSASSHSNNANLQLPSLGSTPPSSAAAASPVILEATSPTSITQSPIWLLKEGRRRLLLCFWLIFIPTRSYELYDAMLLHKKEAPQDGRPFMPLKSLMVILLYSFILPELGVRLFSFLFFFSCDPLPWLFFYMCRAKCFLPSRPCTRCRNGSVDAYVSFLSQPKNITSPFMRQPLVAIPCLLRLRRLRQVNLQQQAYNKHIFLKR